MNYVLAVHIKRWYFGLANFLFSMFSFLMSVMLEIG